MQQNSSHANAGTSAAVDTTRGHVPPGEPHTALVLKPFDIDELLNAVARLLRAA